MFNLSDEGVVEQWIANPYFQYFCGEARFQWKPPCHPTDLVYFRQRIGRQGCEWLFSMSVSVNPEAKPTKDRQEVVSVDTTVQEKNITFPTDAKLYYKIAEQIWDIADRQGITLRLNGFCIFISVLNSLPETGTAPCKLSVTLLL